MDTERAAPVAAGRPGSWFWAHDITPAQLDSVAVPGARLVRLSSYGRRFAALLYFQAGPDRGYAVDLDAAALASRLAAGVRPVAITAGAEDGEPRYSLVFEAAPGPPASVHVDLDEGGLRELSDDRHSIADLAAYDLGGRRAFAAIVQDRTGPTELFTGLRPRELTARLRERHLAPVRLRAYREAGQPRLAGLAEPAPDRGRAWHVDLDADAVARHLERAAGYPLDLDATRADRGVRFTVVIARQR